MQIELQLAKVPQTVLELQQILLENRQIGDGKTFFDPVEPSKLSASAVGIATKAMAHAVKQLNEAREKQHKVLVFGDYDADGLCATATLWQTLHHLGFSALPFIPNRKKHGYGLSDAALDDILAVNTPDLIITVDTGIVAHAAVARLKSLGVTVIVTDHHQPEETLPNADAVVHTTQLCGTTVAWMLAKELDAEFAQTLLDLTAVATIGDLVPLIGPNRSFALHGLTALRQTQRTGLLALAFEAKLALPEITSDRVGYSLVPRLNAMGRLADSTDGLRLLCTKQMQTAQSLAHVLQTTNVKRQELTESLTTTAIQLAQSQTDERVLVVHSDLFHEGVVGLVAGRLVELFYKPVIVISSGEITSKASARSIPGVNIVSLIRQVRDDLLEVGGHPMAAGFSIMTEKIELVSQRLFVLAKQQITTEQLVPHASVECALPEGLLTVETAESLERFQPFGQANRRPIFAFSQASVVTATTMGKQGDHLKLQLQWEHGISLTAIQWRTKEKAVAAMAGKKIQVVGSLEVSEWRNERRLQILIDALEIVQ